MSARGLPGQLCLAVTQLPVKAQATPCNQHTIAQIDFHGSSSFDEVPLTFTDHPELSSVIEENYENSRIYRLGAEWRLSETWDLRGGYFYDESPAPVEAVSPLLPDADRHGVALGATLRLGRLRIDAANWFLFFAERSTEGRNRDNHNGT